MSRLFKSVKKKAGLKPGSVVYVGKKRTEEIFIDVIDYDERGHTEKRLENVEDCFDYKDSPTISWINVTGIHTAEIVEKIGGHFGIHPLILEDIVNTGHRPKIEDAGEYICIILKMLYADSESGELTSEQVGILFGKNWVITFQETGQDVFDHVRRRIRETTPRVRLLNADFLAYSLMDAVVDNYFIVLEDLGEQIETLEDRLTDNPDLECLEIIRNLKRELIYMRKIVWPLREVIGGLERSESSLIAPLTEPYLRDLYEHTVHVIDTVEIFREMVSGLLDLYHTGVSNHMNEVMKVLTIIATIFIPLGFLAGVYGMNFDTEISPLNLPELGLPFGYIGFWGVVLLIGGAMFMFFKRKKWL
jgi:magnesium transporter